MPEFINLVPDAEKQEQVKSKAVKVSTILTIVLLLIVGGIAAWVFFSNSQLQTKLDSTNTEIEGLRGQISALSRSEITARNLSTKIAKLEGIFNTRLKYSFLLSQLEKRTTPGIRLTNFSFGTNSTLNLTGVGDNYILVAKFIRDLTDVKYPGAEPGYEDLFTSVTLNSVNLTNSENKADFFIIVAFNPARLQGF